MSDMYFKSLPDTSTPLIPSNLDKLNDIKVSPTEPTTNEKVWIDNINNIIKAKDDDNEFQEIYNEKDIKGKILWANPDPNSSFSPQDITLSSGDYDVLEWYFKTTVTENEVLSTKNIKGYKPKLAQFYCGADGIVARDRNVYVNSDISFSIDAGRYCSNGSTGRVEDNTYIIPVYVIGYKTNLF